MFHSELPNTAKDMIYNRRSIRSYMPEKIDQDTINVLLDAAAQAPTAMHEESWEFIIIQNPDKLKSLSDKAKVLFLKESKKYHLRKQNLDIFKQPDFNIFYNANTLIIICGKALNPFVMADCWLAAENLMLAAYTMKLGTCVIGSALLALNTPGAKAEFNIPEDITAIAPIIVGIPRDHTSDLNSREKPHIISWQ